MKEKIILAIITICFSACSSAPFKPPLVNNVRTFDIPSPQIINKLREKLPEFFETSSTPPAIERKTVDLGEALIIKNYKPNDSSFTECNVANNGGWANIWNGLDHGKIGIIFTPQGSSTRVQINSSFHENYSVKVPGEVVGYVNGYAVQGTDWIDKGSHCYSTGIIERLLFELIQGNGVSTNIDISPTLVNQNSTTKIKNEMPDGKTITLPDGTKIDTEIKDGSLKGKTVMTMPDGTKFIGNLKNGKLEGPGEMSWPNNTKFIGEFKNGAIVGQATLVLPDGTRKVGTFRNGEFVQ